MILAPQSACPEVDIRQARLEREAAAGESGFATGDWNSSRACIPLLQQQSDPDSNDDSKRSIPGETIVLANLRGPGMVTHIRLTVAANRIRLAAVAALGK